MKPDRNIIYLSCGCLHLAYVAGYVRAYDDDEGCPNELWWLQLTEIEYTTFHTCSLRRIV